MHAYHARAPAIYGRDASASPDARDCPSAIALYRSPSPRRSHSPSRRSSCSASKPNRLAIDGPPGAQDQPAQHLDALGLGLWVRLEGDVLSQALDGLLIEPSLMRIGCHARSSHSSDRPPLYPRRARARSRPLRHRSTPVLQNLPCYAEAPHVSGSCFTTGSSTGASWSRPALPAPQAFCLSGELPASFSN